MDRKPPFILIDGSSYLYRAFHALPQLTNSKGEPTGAIYGVVNMLKRIISDYQPKRIAVVFDTKGKTFRDHMYTAYKATRAPMPNDLRMQLQLLYEVITAMGLPLLMIEGVEADDVIGTLATQASQLTMDTLISTSDKDMAQLVNQHVTLVNTMTNKRLDVAGVVEKFGVSAEKIIDYLALIGDQSDNIPGVKKCGPKTATQWLATYGSLEAIIEHADEIKGQVGQNLRASIPHLSLAKQLVTIRTDVALAKKPEELLAQTPDYKKLAQWFKRLEFKSWLSEALKAIDTPIANHTSNKTYTTILDEATFDTWLHTLQQAKLFAFDTETTSINYMDAEIVGVSFAVTANHAAYVPLAHDYTDAPSQLSRSWVLQKLKPLLESTKNTLVGQHIKYDMNVLAKYGIQLNGTTFDTMLESYCLNSTGTRHNLHALALKYLGKNTIRFADIAGHGAKQLTFNKINLTIATDYAAEDADVTLQLHNFLLPRLQTEQGLINIFQQLEIPLIPVLSKMERTGVLIDTKKLEKIAKQLDQRLQTLQRQAFKLAGKEFNLDSSKQLQQILYDDLKLPISKKTPKGQPSTAESVLRELALNYPLPAIAIEFRTVSKLKSTYAEKLPKLVNQRTGRIHTSYNQTVVSTGRLSSSDPNLQNIPIRSDVGRAIRSAFIAPTGYKLVAADYSQIELRIMAALSRDQGLFDAFAQGLDIHRATAAEVFGIPLEQVTGDQRRKAKAINFGLIYGMSAFGLAKQIGCNRHEAQEYIDIYFNRYPGVKKYMQKMKQIARQQGYVETLIGRRLYLSEINSQNKMRQMAAERTAINAPMQGTAADIIKQAMIDLEQWLRKEKPNAKLIMQVHDELVLEVADQHIKTVEKMLAKIMIAAARLEVPVTVSVNVGQNWQAAH